MLGSYRKSGCIYRLDFNSNEAPYLVKRSPCEPVLEKCGLGEFVRRHRFGKAEQFVGLFVYRGAICLFIENRHYIVDERSEVRIARPPISSFSSTRTLELYQGGKLEVQCKYNHCYADEWEDDDGDIGWWIERELATPQSRQLFLASWPRLVQHARRGAPSACHNVTE